MHFDALAHRPLSPGSYRAHGGTLGGKGGQVRKGTLASSEAHSADDFPGERITSFSPLPPLHAEASQSVPGYRKTLAITEGEAGASSALYRKRNFLRGGRVRNAARLRALHWGLFVSEECS
ncbi:hypothetical protein MRX96_011853 [Rhipicephalus microplus]